VRARVEGLKRFKHPELGRLDLEYTVFQVAEQASLRLYVYTPADEHTEAKLRDSAAKRPGLPSFKRIVKVELTAEEFREFHAGLTGKHDTEFRGR